MLTAIHGVLLVFVALFGTVVALTRDPSRQALVMSFYGLLLAILFLTLQAPDVAFSEIVAGTVAIPLMILVAIAKVRKNSE